jgi:adenine deaminase
VETPFDGRWTKFEEKFKARFKTVDEQYSACKYIKSLKQDSLSIVKYIAKFAEYKDHTGFSPEDLRKRLREGLASYIKDTMANSECKTTTYKELVETTQVLNKRYQECRAEKAREQG